MGRYSTGAETCEGSKRIELSYLLRSKMLVKGKQQIHTLNWTDGRGRNTGNILLYTCYKEEEKYIRLIYKITERDTGKRYPYDYKIQLTSVPSNLGEGEILYFVCPYSGNRCRVLYSAYSHHRWKSRKAYNHRLYYNCQISSKMDAANDRYWSSRKKLDKIWERKYLKTVYNSKPTKIAKRIERLENQRDHWERVRWMPHCMPLALRRAVYEGERFG